MIDLSFFNARRRWAAAIIVAACAATPTLGRAQTTYALSGEFTSFRTWLPASTAFPASVAGVALVDSGQFAGTYNGQSFNWSQKVLLPALTQSVDFTYVAVPPNPSVYEANNLSFTPSANVSVDPGVPFVLGSFSFTNGQWFYRAELGARFSATPTTGGPASTYDDTIVLLSNSPSPPYTPLEQADFFYLAAHPELGSVRVYDSFSQPPGNPGATGTADFIAKIGPLDAVAFEATNDAAFVSSSILPDPVGVVPEPSTWATLTLGMLALAWRKIAARA
jgi:PEP-CTERM motif